MALLLVPLALAGCGRNEQSPANHAAAADFVPPVTQKATVLPGQAHTNPITAYVGKYPNDTVDGVGFYDRTEVRSALIDAVFDQKVRSNFTMIDQTAAPIFKKGDRIAAWGCEPHDCSNRNWTFLVQPDGSRGEACYHEAAMGDRSRWFVPNTEPAMRPGACPQA